MFLSLVRPDRISSPMTRMAAVTMLMTFPFPEARYNAFTSRQRKTEAPDERTRCERAAPADRVRPRPGASHDRCGRHDPHRLPGAARRLRSEPCAPVPCGGRAGAGARL